MEKSGAYVPPGNLDTDLRMEGFPNNFVKGLDNQESFLKEIKIVF